MPVKLLRVETVEDCGGGSDGCSGRVKSRSGPGHCAVSRTTARSNICHGGDHISA